MRRNRKNPKGKTLDPWVEFVKAAGNPVFLIDTEGTPGDGPVGVVRPGLPANVLQKGQGAIKLPTLESSPLEIQKRTGFLKMVVLSDAKSTTLFCPVMDEPRLVKLMSQKFVKIDELKKEYIEARKAFRAKGNGKGVRNGPAKS